MLYITQISSIQFCNVNILSKDMNNILNCGDVPNIYANDDQDTIMLAMKSIVMDQGLPATKSNMFNAYTKRVRANLHCVICMR